MSDVRDVPHDRGERLHPGRFHPRYCVLTGLARVIEHAIAGVPPGAHVLDYGCGARPYEPLVRARGAMYVSADLPGNDAADVTVDDDGCLPSGIAAVDCVLSTQVLEHVTDPDRYLGEAHRVLQPRGLLVLSTHGLWLHHPDPIDHWRWTASGLHALVERAGFEVMRTHRILGPAAAVLQLWQDVTLPRLPAILRRPYAGLMQTAVGLADRVGTSRPAADAAVHVVCARRR